MTQKKGGGFRMCIELTEPNKAVVIYSHPLPHIDALFTELWGATVFSSIDLAPAYHQQLLHKTLPHCSHISWYGKFIPDYATITEPLCEVLRASANANFKWTDKAEHSFTILKDLIVRSPVLALFDPQLPTYITTDASNYGVVVYCLSVTQMHRVSNGLCISHPLSSQKEVFHCWERSTYMSMMSEKMENISVGTSLCAPNKVPSPHHAPDIERDW